jgi:hypothetical protein
MESNERRRCETKKKRIKWFTRKRYTRAAAHHPANKHKQASVVCDGVKNVLRHQVHTHPPKDIRTSTSSSKNMLPRLGSNQEPLDCEITVERASQLRHGGYCYPNERCELRRGFELNLCTFSAEYSNYSR